jgi:hypothetical protein
MAKRKNKKNKIDYKPLILSLVLIVIIYLINRLIFIRPLLWVLAVILLMIFL